MRFNPQKRDPVRLFGKRAAIIGVSVGVIILAVAVWDVYKKKRESGSLRSQAESELADLQLRQAQLQKYIAELKTDRGMESALREQYKLAKNGEGLVIIIDPPSTAGNATTSPVVEWFHRIFPWLTF